MNDNKNSLAGTKNTPANMADKKKKFHRSVRTELLLVSVLSAIIVIGAIALFISIYFQHHLMSRFHEPLQKIIEYVITEIELDHNRERFNAIARKTGMEIAYINNDGDWAFAGNQTLDRRLVESLDDKTRDFGILNDFFYARISNNSGTFIFMLPGNILEKKRGIVFLGIMFGSIFVIFSISWIFIRLILRPLNTLKHGVDEIEKGNLTFEMPVTGRNEFGELTASFNMMTQRIRRMLDLKDQLLLDVGHELRSPVTRLRVQAEFVDDARVRESLVEDISTVDHMVRELLESARISSEHGGLVRTPSDIRAIIREIAASFSFRKPGISPEFPDAPVMFDMDTHRFSTMLRNIVDNALRYSADQALPVRVRICERYDPLRTIELVIIDHGIGIPQKHLPYIFEPFYRVDSSRSKDTGGYGLGFSLSKHIAEAHGGTIEIESELGKGTCVTLRFPTAG